MKPISKLIQISGWPVVIWPRGYVAIGCRHFRKCQWNRIMTLLEKSRITPTKFTVNFHAYVMDKRGLSRRAFYDDDCTPEVTRAELLRIDRWVKKLTAKEKTK